MNSTMTITNPKLTNHTHNEFMSHIHIAYTKYQNSQCTTIPKFKKKDPTHHKIHKKLSASIGIGNGGWKPVATR